MQALAKQILAKAPTLVSLQELDQWYSGPFGLGTRAWRRYDWDRPRQVTKITYPLGQIERAACITMRQGEFGSPEHAGGRVIFIINTLLMERDHEHYQDRSQRRPRHNSPGL